MLKTVYANGYSGGSFDMEHFGETFFFFFQIFIDGFRTKTVFVSFSFLF